MQKRRDFFKIFIFLENMMLYKWTKIFFKIFSPIKINHSSHVFSFIMKYWIYVVLDKKLLENNFEFFLFILCKFDKNWPGSYDFYLG